MKPIGRWMGVVLMGALLVWAAGHAWRGARTGDVLLDTLQALRIWGGVTSLPPPGEWQARWTRLNAAREMQPDNPDIEESLGLLASRRADDHALLREAAEHHARAIRLRPISANTWANLAEALYLVNDTGSRFALALRNAARLGPSNPQVQRIAALYGLATYAEVDAETRKSIDAMVAAGMRRDPGEMLSIAHRRGRLGVACAHLAATPRRVDPRWPPLCAQAGAAARPGS